MNPPSLGAKRNEKLAMIALGIDLGTTYSCVVHHTSTGDDHLIPSGQGADLTPSVVYFDPDGSVLVGDAAKRLLKTDPGNVVVGIKRHMGQDHPLEFHGRMYTPEAISGVILRRLCLDATTHLGVEQSQLQWVITVPAYFGVAEKEATYAAVRIAGLNCLELLAEPIAAAYANGVVPNNDESSLVFDLGGGTFDVAVVGVVDNYPRIWAVDGENQLGGLDWDRRLADLLWEGLTTQGIDDEAIYDDEFAASLMSEAELMKRQMSGHDAATARIRHAGTTYTVSVTRSSFESATADLVGQCLAAAKRVTASAQLLGAHKVTRVLLVGGSVRMPMIRAALEHELRLPTFIDDPEKAVARGAAILANNLQKQHGILGVRSPDQTGARQIAPVLPKGIGIKTHSSKLPPRPEPYILSILSQNTPLPVGKRVTVATMQSNQSTARIEIYEQAGSILSQELSANRLLFDGEVVGIASGPAGSPIVLSVTVEIDGRINVTAADGTTGGPLELEAFIHGVIDDQELSDQASKVANLVMVK